ncbi:Protein GDS1 [Candida viswanathii]|uniref:Protein GDS1 n=1 Tax=Candida viswanathii TaxID=5486 RepID=A0A367YGM2_9ASCO|nr:Protein GDS1 [Candida viswanathii]
MDESTSPSPLPSPVASKESTPPTPPDNENSNCSTTTTTRETTKKVKKIKPISRAPIATGISTNIPVTGEKPKPIQEGDASLEDNVLYSIFVILYEKDAPEEGMTVKQLCEMLETLHPELVNMSSKTSNLVSAKLNAYIKKLEKADTSLKYAISREWADASPKRMVYKYRGLLAPGWEKVLDELKKSEEYEQLTANNESMKKVESSVKNLDLSDNDNDEEGETTTTVKKAAKESQSTSASPKQKVKHLSEQKLQQPQPQSQQQQQPVQQTQAPAPQGPTKRRATMFDFGRRPSFLNLDEFPEPPPPYLVNKTKITSAIDDDEVFIDIEEDEEEEEEEHHVIVKKRRTISSISKFNWGNLGATELDTAAITAMRRESVSMFEVGVCFPSPLDTSLQDLDKMFSK